MRRQIIIEICCAIFALLFLYAGISKLMDYQTFTLQLSKSPMLTNYAQTIAWSIPVAEIGIAIMLFIGGLRLFALYAFLFLMSSFTIYLITILTFSYYIPCSCGGILQNMSWETHITFNIVFIVAAVWILIIQNSNSKDHISHTAIAA